jgi:hypothetical protein
MIKNTDWHKVKSSDPTLVRWAHDCDSCGQPDVQIYVTTAEFGKPGSGVPTSHAHSRECIDYRKMKAVALKGGMQ